MAQRVRVLIADDHPVYLDGLTAAIERTPGLDVVAACGNGIETLRRIEATQPDVAALDLLLPGMTATAILEALSAGEDGTKVLVFSAYTDPQAVYDTVQAGARGYVPKSWARSRIVSAIAAVASGRTVLADEVQDGIGEEIRRRGALAQERLTTREREVLELLAEGLTAPQMADRLFLSVSTVKSHQHGVYEKLGVSDRAAAVAAAMRRGLIR